MDKKNQKTGILSMLLIGGSVAAFAIVFAQEGINNAFAVIPAILSVIGALLLGKQLS